MKKLAWILHICQCSVHIYFNFSLLFYFWTMITNHLSLPCRLFSFCLVSVCLPLNNWVIWLISTSNFPRCWVLFFHKSKSGFLCWGLFHFLALPSFGQSVLGAFSCSCTCFSFLPFRKSTVIKKLLPLCFVFLLDRRQCVPKVLTDSGFSPKFCISILVTFNIPPQSEIPSWLMRLVWLHLLTHTWTLYRVLSVKLSISDLNPDDS